MDAKTPKAPKNTTRKVPSPLKFSEGYASVEDMIRGTVGNEAAENFKEYSDARRLMNCLTVLRCSKEVSQTELANRMGCGQPKVSKMEASTDDELNFGDVVNYATSLKMGMHILFTPHHGNGVNHIRFHLGCIKRELDALVRLAGNDKSIGNGVEAFALDTLQQMISVIEGSLEKLPHRSKSDASVRVEAEDERGQPLPIDSPKRTPKRSSKKVTV